VVADGVAVAYGSGLNFTIMRRFFLIAISVLPAIALAQTKAPKVYKRAQPPKFTKPDPFYADAFKEALVGDRPANLGSPASIARSANEGPIQGRSASEGPGGDSTIQSSAGWSRLISATTIEDAIKSLKLQIDKQITTASDFAKNHNVARRDYTVVATLFAIAGQYDGDVRWKKDAPAARDVFARSAANFKVGTAQAYAEAKERKAELNELLSGSSPFGGKEAEAKPDWGKVAGRAPLMQYLESAWEPKLKASLADKGQFTAASDKILREAELFAAIGEVLAQEGMEDADAEEYRAFCHQLRDGAKQIIDAVKLKNYDQAAAGSTTIGKACTECHENYRS
jgi:hypothetical protein